MYSEPNMSEQPLPLEQLRGLLEKLREAQARTDERAKATHERFNVFTTLLETNDEVRLHSRFLHCLLNPQGRHDCGVLFLKLFFETLKKCPVLNHEGKEVQIDFPDPDESWKSEIEFNVPDVGRIDILLKHQKFGIAIENKPNPDKQEDQLKRYADWMSGQFDSSHVIYLTRHGGQSSTHLGSHYLRISYAKHILAWLDTCLRETYDVIPINQALLQYRAVVRELTGKNLESKTMKEIADFIKDHPDIIRFRSHILAGIDEARANFLDGLAVKIKDELVKDGFVVTAHPKNADHNKFGNSDDRLILTPPSYSVLHDAPFKIWIEYDYKYTRSLMVEIVTEDLHYKTCSEPDTKLRDVPSGLFERMKGRMIDSFRGDDRYDPKEIFGGVCPTGVFKIARVGDDECLAELMKTPFDKTASDVCKSIRQYIELLVKIYSKAAQ